MKIKLLLFQFLTLLLLILATLLVLRFSKNIFINTNRSQTQLSQFNTSNTIKLIKSGTISQLFRTYYYWIFENTKYPCGKEGNHQFVIFQKDSSNDKRNLLVRYVGGFAGFFYPDSTSKLTYFPDSSFENLLRADTYTGSISVRGLDRLIVDTKGWRIMSPSYCSHDLYLGKGQYNQTDGFARWGYNAVEDAINFTQVKFSTNRIIMYGTSAGSSGAFYHGINRKNVAGIVMDSFVVDLESLIKACEEGIQPYNPKWSCTCNNQICVRVLGERVGFTKNDQPYFKINNKEVNVPLFVIFDKNDYLYNGHVNIEFSNTVQAIHTYNPGGKSVVQEVCVNDPKRSDQTCNMHSPTLENNQAAREVYKWILSLERN